MAGATGMAGAAAMADALMRSVGGRQVLLRVPAPAAAGDLGEQVGLAIPQFQDVELAPVVFRRSAGHELLISGSTVAALLGSLQFGSAALLFQSAAGVVIDDVLFAVLSVASAEAFGAVYLYRVKLQPPAV
jgi:hypothetical protein